MSRIERATTTAHADQPRFGLSVAVWQKLLDDLGLLVGLTLCDERALTHTGQSRAGDWVDADDGEPNAAPRDNCTLDRGRRAELCSGRVVVRSRMAR